MFLTIVPSTRIKAQTTRPGSGLRDLDLTVTHVFERNERQYIVGLTQDGDLSTIRADRIAPFVYAKDGTATAPTVEVVELEENKLSLAVMPGFSAQFGFVEDVQGAGKALLVKYQGGRPMSEFVVDSVKVEICGPQELIALNQAF